MSKYIDFMYNNCLKKIFYDDDYFCITTDNLSLVDFIELKKSDRLLVEFGSGLLTVPLLLSTKTNIKMVGIEKNSKACELAKCSLIANNLGNRIEVLNDDVANINKYFLINSIDVIVCNPPYFTLSDENIVSNNENLKLARHEVSMNLTLVASLAKKYLKEGGRLIIINRASRLFEIRDILFKNNLAIKKMQFIYHDINKNAKLVLIEARKNGREHNLVVLKPKILERSV